MGLSTREEWGWDYLQGEGGHDIINKEMVGMISLIKVRVGMQLLTREGWAWDHQEGKGGHEIINNGRVGMGLLTRGGHEIIQRGRVGMRFF